MLRADLLQLYGRLHRHGMMIGSSGNVSARAGAGMLITPTGCDIDSLAADHMVEMSLAGAAIGLPRAHALQRRARLFAPPPVGQQDHAQPEKNSLHRDQVTARCSNTSSTKRLPT